MSHPKVVDANGNELHIGDLVQFVAGGIVGRIEEIGNFRIANLPRPQAIKVGRGWESGRSLIKVDEHEPWCTESGCPQSQCVECQKEDK